MSASPLPCPRTTCSAPENAEREFAALRSPDDLLVVAAGGPAGGFAAVIPPWFGEKSQAVTCVVQGRRAG